MDGHGIWRYMLIEYGADKPSRNYIAYDMEDCLKIAHKWAKRLRPKRKMKIIHYENVVTATEMEGKLNDTDL